MKPNDYQDWVVDNWDSAGGTNLTSRDDYIMACGLGGECGEVLEVLKKIERDGKNPESKYFDKIQAKEMLTLELGDLLYYLTMIAARHDIPLEELMHRNVEKLTERKAAKRQKDPDLYLL